MVRLLFISLGLTPLEFEWDDTQITAHSELVSKDFNPTCDQFSLLYILPRLIVWLLTECVAAIRIGQDFRSSCSRGYSFTPTCLGTLRFITIVGDPSVQSFLKWRKLRTRWEYLKLLIVFPRASFQFAILVHGVLPRLRCIQIQCLDEYGPFHPFISMRQLIAWHDQPPFVKNGLAYKFFL